MIITVGNTKGGVGKTTLAINLAIASALAGRRVWLVDGDRQATASTAITIRSESGQSPEIACARYEHGPTLRAQVKLQEGNFDDIIIDAGGRDSGALRAALSLTDILVVPFQPRSYDVWALEDIANLVDEARSTRDGLRAYAMLSLADPATKSGDNTEAATAAGHFSGLEFIETPIRRRKAFANAAGRGLSVLEFTPKDPRACQEISTFIELILNIQTTFLRNERDLNVDRSA